MAKQKTKNKSKVFIGPVDVGTNANLKRILEKYGYKVTTCSFFGNAFKFDDDLTLNLNPDDPKWLKILKAFPVITKVFSHFYEYQIFHFRYGISFLPFGIDLPFLRLFGKKIIMQFEGDDLRQKNRLPKNKVSRLLISETKDNNRILNLHKRIKHFWIKLWANKTIVVTPDLLAFAPEAEWVMNFVPNDSNTLTISKNQVIRILHAPTDEKIKGTRFIVRAVKKLEKKYPVKLILIKKLSHDKVMESYQHSDIVIDQLLVGAYGVVAIEAMKYKKPVVCYLRKDLISLYPKAMPIINADPDNCYQRLEELIKNKKLRDMAGQNSRKYFLRYHSEIAAQKKWQKIYEEL